MNSAALLDLLGNENRRRILRLLARKPCYVTEMSEELGVSPKAVIDHLQKLEEAGLVESRVDDRRRKYFHIARDLRLEVTVSPYRFGTKSAYPGRGFDLTRCRYVSIDIDATPEETAAEDRRGSDRGDADATRETLPGGRGDRGKVPSEEPSTLAARLDRLEDLEEELSLAQRWVQAQLTETIERVAESVESEEAIDERLYADVLLTVQEGAGTTEAVAERLEASVAVVREAVNGLVEAGFVEREEGTGRLRVAE